MIRKNAFWLCLALFGLQPFAQAQSSIDEKDSAYFTIQDSTQSTPADTWKNQWQEPTALLHESVSALAKAASRLSLLKWVRHDGTPPQSPEPYNRKKHFGTWVNDPTDQECYNTRAQILIRDSQEPVKFKDTNHCVVDSGYWEDPYSGSVHRSARDIQIDHVVPLKNAFSSGAWKWNSKKRCLYANFMANKFHLIAVDGHENMAKGDSAPNEYLPPNSRYVCQYLEEWLKIKMIWKLEMLQTEADAIKENIQKYGCDLKNLSILDSDLTQQRAATSELQVICTKMALRLDQAATTQEPLREASFPADETQ